MPPSLFLQGRQALVSLQRDLLDLLFPTHCAGCGMGSRIWCEACAGRLVRVRRAVCLACRQPATRASRHDCPDGSPLAFSAARYRAPLDRALTRLKYRPDSRLVEAMVDLLVEAQRGSGLSATCVVPVPLGERRQRQRGYNQAELLGRALAGRLAVPSVPLALTRIRETGSQVGLDPRERWDNVAGAFRAEPPLVRSQDVLLVDDVHTTGATLAACAAALGEAGARSIAAVTVGRV